MPGDSSQHTAQRVLAPARPQNPGEGQSGETAQRLDGAGASRIHETAAQPELNAELRQPSAAPDPVREQRVGESGQQSGGGATGAQPPAVGTGAQRKHRREANREQLQ